MAITLIEQICSFMMFLQLIICHVLSDSYIFLALLTSINLNENITQKHCAHLLDDSLRNMGVTHCHGLIQSCYLIVDILGKYE